QDFFPKKSSVSAIVTKVAPNRILLFSGLFQILKSENELLAVIAHELVHFYRAHAAGVRLYDYCYEITAKNHGHRPKPDPKLNDLCEKLHPRIGFSIEEATQRRLGVYTQEQEADEMALEILAWSGIPPTAAVEAWFSLSRGLGTSSNAEPAISMEECLRLRSSGWVDSQGREVFIPVGDYRDEHHSWCYRIHNIDKEIAAHQYPSLPKAIPEANWGKVQAMAKNLD
ncbi:MAG: M48 family metalloprotease, partial [Deltaproteobacteria bacterium]